MSKPAGQEFGSYQITSLLGKGGMGEVYRARDTKLGRDVAIKILPEEFARDRDRLSRFEREAKLLASLNHPNIAAIYGLEEVQGKRFLVLELAEGETLADRLKAGAIPVEESLKIAIQVADALDAAHQKGVIHRDLKPANISVTPEGRVKVLDFGLAKALAEDEVSAGLSNSPTLSMAATQQGVILGTAAYMSPEQAKGRAVSKSADIWAFGCVVYEMLTGQAAFDGEDVSEVLASVIKGTTNLSLLPADVHPGVRRVIHRCLEKDVNKRFRDIGDVHNELAEALAEGKTGAGQPAAGPAQSARRSKSPWVVAVLFGIVAGLGGWSVRPSPPRELVTRFDYDLPENQPFRGDGRRVLAISPDGREFAYNTQAGVFVRFMDSSEARLVAGTEKPLTSPVFSPDGEWIGYFYGAGAQLMKNPVRGGAPVPLCRASNPFGVSWGADNSIVYGQPDGIWRCSGNGGAPERIVKAEQGEQVDSPQVLPGGEWVLFTAAKATGTSRWDESTIVAASLKSGERKVLFQGGGDVRYVPTGHLLYAYGDALFAAPMDLPNLKLTGGGVSVVEGVRRAASFQTSAAQYGVSDKGTLVYVPGGVAAQRILALVDRHGMVKPLRVPPKPYMSPRLSADGRKLTVQTDEPGGGVIWTYDLSGSTDIQQLTLNDNNIRPIWTPDSKRVTFASDREGTMSIYWQPADGSGVAERLTTAEKGTEHWPESWSPDGRTLSFVVMKGTDAAVWTYARDTRKSQVFVDDPGIQRGSAFSRDGRSIAYHSNESGQVNIFVKPFPSNDIKHRITQETRTSPVWSPVRDEIFYSAGGAGQFFSRNLSLNPSLTLGSEQQLPMQGFLQFGSGYRSYDISGDGEQFLGVFPVNGSGPVNGPARQQINVILNWFEELNERAPVR